MSDVIERRVDLKAPVARVWRAVTDHEEFGRWFRVALDGPFVAGGESTGRITYPGYEHLGWKAHVKSIEPMRRFAFSWPHEELIEGATGETLVEFLLEEIPQGTRLTIRESGFENIPEAKRAEIFRRNGDGWTEQVKNIEQHVAGGA